MKITIEKLETRVGDLRYWGMPSKVFVKTNKEIHPNLIRDKVGEILKEIGINEKLTYKRKFGKWETDKPEFVIENHKEKISVWLDLNIEEV